MHNNQDMSVGSKAHRHLDQKKGGKNKGPRDQIKYMYFNCGCFWVGEAWETSTFYLLVYQYFLYFSPVIIFENLGHCVT